MEVPTANVYDIFLIIIKINFTKINGQIEYFYFNGIFYIFYYFLNFTLFKCTWNLF